MISLSLEVSTTCKSCLKRVPLNALAEVYHCPNCNKEISVPVIQWQKELLIPFFVMAYDHRREEYSSETEYDRRDDSPADRPELTMIVRREDPVFPGSTTPIEMSAALAAAPQGQIQAPKGNTMCSVREVAEPFHTEFPAVKLLVAESMDQLPGEKSGAALATSSGNTATTFQCPQCGAVLKLEGNSRTVRCNYCNADAYFPDEIWQRLHPTVTVTKWYAFVEPALLRFVWGQLYAAYADDRGNFHFNCRCPQFQDNWVYICLTPELKVRWLSFKDALAGASAGETSPGAGGRILAWSYERDGVSLYSAEDGSKITQIGGRAGKSPQGEEKFSAKESEWVVLDRDETLLTYRRREGKWGFELSRYDLDGHHVPCWQGEGKIGRWSERKFGSDGLYFIELKDRWFRCRDRIQAKPGPDGSMFFLFDGHNSFNLSRYTRDGRRLYFEYYDQHAQDLCGDADGNMYVLLADWGEETRIPYPGGGYIFRYSVLRFGPDGNSPTVIANSVVEGGPLTFKSHIVVAHDGTVQVFGSDGRHVKLAPDGTVLWMSEETKRHAAELRKILEDLDA